MAPQEHSDDTYHPKDALGGALKATAITGAAGVFVSTIQNTLTKQNVGALGIFSRSGSTIAAFAAMGGAFEFTKCAAANLREKDDVYNTTIGGFFAGTILGFKVRSGPAVLGYGSAVAVVLSAFKYTGGKMGGFARDAEIDEVSRKEELRKNRRRPLEETINQLGEGRGLYAPGYAQRRAERIKEAYGIDVPEHSKLSSTPN